MVVFNVKTGCSSVERHFSESHFLRMIGAILVKLPGIDLSIS